MDRDNGIVIAGGEEWVEEGTKRINGDCEN